MPEARFEPIMNSKYKVRSSWGEVLECVIMRKRHRYGTKVHEYFVHYLEVPDRCVDEWILVENILIDEADEGAPGMGRLRRRTRRNYSEDVEIDETQSSRTTSCAAEKQAEEARPSEFTSQTMVKMIINVYFYEYLMSTWYYSPYPSAYEKGFPLLVCHVCFRYFKCKRKYTEHVYKNKCSLHLQLGSVVYENEQLQIRKTTVLSRRERKMCQCMLLLAKLFIDCKSIFFALEDYNFYIAYEKIENDGKVAVGYFSRNIVMSNNLSTITIFPPFHSKGYGKFLISMSYALMPNRSPERPLSDLGALAYNSYWRFRAIPILFALRRRLRESTISVDDFVQLTGLASDDFIEYTCDESLVTAIDQSNGILYVRFKTVARLFMMIGKAKLLFDSKYVVPEGPEIEVID